jgi:cytidylate kinase
MASIDDLINRQFHLWEMQKMERLETPPARERPMAIVTVSRELGSRGSHFASLLAERLGYQMIHKEIVDAICASSGYRKRIVESLDEHYRSRLLITMDSLMTGQAVDHAEYFRHLVSVVLSMARLGGVVLVGRAGNFILGPQKGFHIRLICPKPERIHNLVTFKNMNEAEARSAIEQSDVQRKEFVRKLFNADIDNPHHYDLIINTGYMDIEQCVDPTVEAIGLKMARLSETK